MKNKLIQFLFQASFQCRPYNIFKIFKNICFDHQKLKKTPSKVAQNSSNPLFCPYCPDCPNSRIHVPKSGILTNCIQNWDPDQFLSLYQEPSSKVAQKNSNPLFFPYCLRCPNGPIRRIYVPKCGLQTNCIQNWGGTANKNKDMNEMFLKSHNVYLDLIELQNAPLTHSL